LDPLTHSLLGAAAARATAGRRLGNAALLPGAIGGLLPDLDALIRSASDPLLYAEFHRHFTHSLAFAPVGAVLATLPWLADRRRSPAQRLTYLGAGFAGYLTHGLLDSATTYGTLLLWPFSMERVGLSWISIVDPVFTLILLLGVLLAFWRRSTASAAVALACAALYLGSGAVQRSRAAAAQERIAQARGHDVERAIAIPSFGNQIVWRTVYGVNDSLFLDRIRVPWAGRAGWTGVDAIPRFGESDLPPEIRAFPRLVRDFRRFERFSNGWVALDPRDPTIIGDARYSRSDDRQDPVWAIRLSAAGAAPRTEWIDRSRERDLDVRRLWRQVAGRSGEFEPLPGADPRERRRSRFLR
jgi:inner membrane protein